MNENGKIKLIYSWPVIILFLCFFWPVGAILIVRRAFIDRKMAMRIGGLIGFIGIIFCIFGVIFLLAGICDSTMREAILVGIFFFAAGIVFRKICKKIKNSASNVRKYLALIVNNGVRNMDAIATSVDKNYGTVKADINELIAKGYLKGAYINDAERCLVLPSDNRSNNIASQDNSSGGQVTIVTCSCCGANNEVVGSGGECEYCGAPLK